MLTAALGGGLFLGGCSGDFAFNYRLTVSVRRGGETFVGSNVRRLRWHQGIKQFGFMDVSRWHSQGEATVVDLGPHGVLIATLGEKLFSPETGNWYVGSGAWTPVPAFTRAFGPEFSAWPQHRDQSIGLLASELPFLVTFRDPGAPRSVVEVLPDELTEIFGAGVHLGGIAVEITRARRTRGAIDGELQWLSAVDSSQLPGAKIPPETLYDRLTRQDFKIGN